MKNFNDNLCLIFVFAILFATKFPTVLLADLKKCCQSPYALDKEGGCISQNLDILELLDWETETVTPNITIWPLMPFNKNDTFFLR